MVRPALPLGLATRASAAAKDPADGPAPAAGSTKPAPPAQLIIPPPTGPFCVGTVDLHLVDASRPDPLTPGRPYPLMAGIWYPARDADRSNKPPTRPPFIEGDIHERLRALL